MGPTTMRCSALTSSMQLGRCQALLSTEGVSTWKHLGWHVSHLIDRESPIVDRASEVEGVWSQPPWLHDRILIGRPSIFDR